MAQLGQLDANLQALRPGEDWSGQESFSGDEGLGLGDGTGVLQDLAELESLAEQLGQAYGGARLDDVDVDALARQLGDDAAASARMLADLERAARRRLPAARLRRQPAALAPRRCASSARPCCGRRRAAVGPHRARATPRLAGAAGEQTGASREWEFGDTEPWDVTRTVTNAVRRTVTEGGDPNGGMRIDVRDVEVTETEARTQSAVALLVDVSYSMAAEGRWVPMKRTALALHHLVSTRYRGDRLELVTFGYLAQTMDIDELTGLSAVREQGTNLHHGLLLAEHFRKHPSMQPVLLVVTDGEPTAHLQAEGRPWFAYPPDQETLRLTVRELDRVARLRRPRTTFFRLGDDPGLARFIGTLAERVGGRVVAPDLDELGAAVVDSYLALPPARGGRGGGSGEGRPEAGGKKPRGGGGGGGAGGGPPGAAGTARRDPPRPPGAAEGGGRGENPRGRGPPAGGGGGPPRVGGGGRRGGRVDVEDHRDASRSSSSSSARWVSATSIISPISNVTGA